jgi:glycosyltransferase involved in cell wall biosynthesis
MRILMLSDVSLPRVNGVSTSIQTCRDDLRSMGHRCLLVAPHYPNSMPPGSDDGSDDDVVRIPSRPVPRDPEDRLPSWRLLNRWAQTIGPDEFDLIHVQTPFLAHYLGVRLSRRLAIPIVETYHTYFEHYLHHYVPLIPAVATRAFARMITVSQCHQVATIISPSPQMADALRAYGVRTPIETLPTGLPPTDFIPGDGAAFRRRLGIDVERPVALCLSRVAHEKNIDFLVRMLVHLRQQIPNILLLISGEGPAERHLRALVARLGLQRSVLFLGYQDRTSDLRDCYRAADVFVFASRTETQGLVLLEAMAQGTPVVSTAVMGTVDVLANAGGALIVPEDEQRFAAGVAALLGDRDQREILSRRGIEYAGRWASRPIAQQLVRIYEQTLRANSRPAEAVIKSSARAMPPGAGLP